MKSTIEKFLEFEIQERLFDYYINDYQVWPYIRFSVYMKLEAMLNSQEKRKTNKQNISMQELVSIIRNCTVRNPLLKAKENDILFVTHARRSLIEGKYECLYTDEISSHFAKSISAEFIFETKHFLPIKTHNILYLDYIDIIPGIFYKFNKKRNQSDNNELLCFCNIINKRIYDIFGVDLGQEFFFSMAQKRMVWYKVKKKMLKHLIKKIHPKVIVETVSYETNKMIINEIGKELGIPTVELQHGVIGPGHIAYNYIEKKEFDYLPDYVCLFSEYWKKTARFAQTDEKLLCLGYPYLERMMSRFPKKIERISAQSDEVNILVLSQPEYSLKLYDEIYNLIEKLDDIKFKFNLYYKLHPAEYNLPKEQFSKIESHPSVEVIRTSDVNLYELFAKANIQIGVTSTAIFEGLAYGLGTLILHYEKTDSYMGDICNNHYAVMCENAEELAVQIQKYTYNGCDNKKEEFFVSNATSNIVAFLQGVLMKG